MVADFSFYEPSQSSYHALHRTDPMQEFVEIAKQTRLMALATQGELVTTHSHIKRFERQLDVEREARLRLEVCCSLLSVY